MFPGAGEAPRPRVRIAANARKRAVLEASLVLASEGVRHWIEYAPVLSGGPDAGDDGLFELTVEEGDAARARAILERHAAENAGYVTTETEIAPFDLHVSPALHLLLPALFSFWSSTVSWGKWMERQGGAAAERILDGEWWRTLTATTLHADSEHFLGNMLSGYFILNLLRRRMGIGTSMLLLTVAAALANRTVAAFSPPYYFSIGFSTVVFAGLGLLAGVETRFFPRGLRPGLRNLTPLLGAFFLAVMTGLGENADIKAHFIGFGYGLLCAPPALWMSRRGADARPGWQLLAVLAVYAAYAVAWWLAIR